MPRFEQSCGIVLFYEEEGRLREFLLLHYPTGHWDFAKGHVERDEEELATALREAREETGLRDIEVVPDFRHAFEYVYRHRSVPVRKRVTWFLGRVRTKDVTISDEHRGFAWLPFQEARQRITYENAKELLQKAESHLVATPPSRWF